MQYIIDYAKNYIAKETFKFTFEIYEKENYIMTKVYKFIDTIKISLSSRQYPKAF